MSPAGFETCSAVDYRVMLGGGLCLAEPQFAHLQCGGQSEQGKPDFRVGGLSLVYGGEDGSAAGRGPRLAGAASETIRQPSGHARGESKVTRGRDCPLHHSPWLLLGPQKEGWAGVGWGLLLSLVAPLPNLGCLEGSAGGPWPDLPIFN